MDPSQFPTAGEPPQPPLPKKKVPIQGPRPSALKLHQDSQKIKKPPLPPPRQPVIIYAVSPKIIHTEVSNFMSVVQRLTGLSSGDFSDDGAVSPAARLAATEKASPRPSSSAAHGISHEAESVDHIMEMVEGVDLGQFPGILSPAPATLPPVPTGFFSPMSNNTNPLAFLNETTLSPFFMASPSGLFSGPSVVSPLHSPDYFSLFMDF